MQIDKINLMKEVPPGVAQIKQHIVTLQKRQRNLNHYPKVIKKLREFKQAYPILPRYVSPHASEEMITIDGVNHPVRYFTKSEKAEKLVLFIPGGNFCYDQQYDYDRFIENLLDDETQAIIKPYPLAPESIFPESHENVLSWVTHMLANKGKYVQGDEVILCGVGSGSHIALWVYHQLKIRESIKKMVLIDGLYQVNALALSDLPSAESLSGTLGCYFVDQIHNNPDINLLQKFTPTDIPLLIVTGSGHRIAHESIQLAAIAGFHSTNTNALIVPGAMNEFLMYDDGQSKEAMTLIRSWINQE